MLRPSNRRVPIPTIGVIVSALTLLSPTAGAQGPAPYPPWYEAMDMPFPARARSVAALIEEVQVRSAPSRSSRLRGVVAAHVPLPFYAWTQGPGCPGRWIEIGPLAWICHKHMQFLTTPPIPPDFSVYRETEDGLPYHYFFVQRDGTPAYSRLRFVSAASPTATLEKGFGVAIIDRRIRDGVWYGKTTYNLWLPLDDLAPARIPKFHGVQVSDGKLNFAWVVQPFARSFASASTARPLKTRHARFERVTIVETKEKFGRRFYRLEDGTWMRAKDVRKPSVAPPPPGLGNHERWIDVEIASQTLVAYEGTQPVYATLVSTGRGRQGTDLATPKGVHRIWIKLVASTMDNFENDTAQDYYSIEDVPYVQYFHKGVGLHAAFWHRRFGFRHSHGCVNLPPKDARWLFHWTSPHLPAGWRGVMPSAYEPGTIVRVR